MVTVVGNGLGVPSPNPKRGYLYYEIQLKLFGNVQILLFMFYQWINNKFVKY